MPSGTKRDQINEYPARVSTHLIPNDPNPPLPFHRIHRTPPMFRSLSEPHQERCPGSKTTLFGHVGPSLFQSNLPLQLLPLQQRKATIEPRRGRRAVLKKCGSGARPSDHSQSDNRSRNSLGFVTKWSGKRTSPQVT